MNVAMNQACSIQNYGARCESVTVGHNPYKFRLSKNSLALPTIRPKFLCEHELELQLHMPSRAHLTRLDGSCGNCDERPWC